MGQLIVGVEWGWQAFKIPAKREHSGTDPTIGEAVVPKLLLSLFRTLPLSAMEGVN